MYDRILFPTDGSDEASAGADAAIQMASVHDATLHVLTVADTAQDSVTTIRGDVIDTLVAEGEKIVAAIEDRARQRGVAVRTAVLQGDPSGTIVDYAEEYAVDLVVMPTQGRRGLERALLGSVTERVVSTASVPVLVLNAGSDQAFTYPFEHVLVPTDGTPAGQQGVSVGIDIADSTDAAMSLLTVVEVGSLGPDVRSASTAERLTEEAEAILEDARTHVTEAGSNSVETTVDRGRPDQAIRSYIDDHDIDLVVLGTEAEPDFGTFLWGGVTSKLVRTSPVPVLITRRSAARSAATSEG